jgi:hypothetical protein
MVEISGPLSSFVASAFASSAVGKHEQERIERKFD